MSQVLIIKNKGLNTAPNEFSSVPEGSVVVANNCSIDQDNVIEPRRGFARFVPFPDPNDRARRFVLYQGRLIAAYSNGKIAYEDSGSWVDYSGTYNDPDPNHARIKFVLAGSGCYFTSTEGIYRIGSYNDDPQFAGAPKGLDLELTTTGIAGFFATNNQVAYRMVWGLKELDGTVIIGAPSGRAVLANTSGGSFDVNITFTVPSSVTTQYFYQIYRSALSGDSAVEPSDEMSLVYEAYPTPTEIAQKYVTLTDSTPDSLRGATLYTSPSQEGILQSNEMPPMAKDIALFENCLFFANCKSKQRVTITLVSASVLTVGDVLTINGITYTANSSEDILTRSFLIATSGTPAQNIADTVTSLIRVINRCSANTEIYATLLSGASDLPGQILLEERGLNGAPFSITISSNGNAFSPEIPLSGTELSSISDNFSNQLYFSKRDKFDSVPLTNYLFIGSKNNKILRIFPLKNSLFVFKENEGIFRVTGYQPGNFSVELFDSSANLIAPETLDVINNQLWCLSDQGLITLTETGVQVISRPIENLLLNLYGDALENVKRLSFGVGYESDRRYILFTVRNSQDLFCTQAFAWNTFTRTFTMWDKTATAGVVSVYDKKLYLGEGDSNYTLQERKSFTYSDYVDHAFPVVVSAINKKEITLADASGCEVGDVFYQGTVGLPIQEIVNNTITLPLEMSEYVVGDASILKAYETTIEYSPITAGNPGTLKQWPELAILLKGPRFYKGLISFATDTSGSFESTEFYGLRNGLWGAFSWSQSHWGVPAPSAPIRVYVPTEKQYGSFIRVRLRFREGFSPWKMDGISLPYRETKSFYISK